MVRTSPFQPAWQFSEAGKNSWLPAKVPGTVHTDLFQNGKIEDPLYDDNHLQLKWIEEKEWHYSAEFNVSDSILKFRCVDFIFKGIDTYATVLINDSVLFRSDNMFREWRTDGKRFLKEGANKIIVQLHSPAAIGIREAKKLTYRLPMSNDAGDEPFSSFTRKAPYHFGWDWAPRMLVSGIWKEIFISAHDGVFIKDISVKTIEMADTCVWLSGFVTISSFIDLPNATITIMDGFKQFRLKKGVTTTAVKFKIDQPELWWPNGFGNQPLYDIDAKLYINGYRVDSLAERIGIRTIELFQDEDEWGRGFYFRVNGLPVFMKGANYVPQSIFLPSVTEKDYQKIINDVKNSGMNMLRVWGGGIYENDLFYDLCDENGILVWQDFMFACSMYPGDSLFVNNVRNEIAYQVARLRNHPSVALWCGNNEIDVAWRNWGWQKEFMYTPADSSKIYDDYKNLFEQVIPGMLAELDNERPYIPSSPISNWGTAENFKSGNMHYWGVWHGEQPIDSFSVYVPRFMTEYGMQSYPSFQTLRKNTSPGRITMGSGFIRNRQKSYKGNRLLLDYIDKQFGPVKNTEELAYLSQLNQAEAMRIAIQSHRKEARYCMGTLYWQLNDVWDGASWSTIEYNKTWKVAQYRLRDLYAKHILITETVNDTITIYLQSDDTEGIAGKLKVEILDFKGRSMGIYWKEATTGYLVATKIFEMPLREILRGNDPASFFLKINLLDADSTIIQSVHFFKKPKELKLQAPEIRKEIQSVADGAIIKLFSRNLVRGVLLEYENSTGHFSDNYFDLLPGEEKVIHFKGNPGNAELMITNYLPAVR